MLCGIHTFEASYFHISFYRGSSKIIIPVMVISHMGVLGNMFGSGLQICDSYGIFGWLICSFYDTIIMEDSFECALLYRDTKKN